MFTAIGNKYMDPTGENTDLKKVSGKKDSDKGDKSVSQDKDRNSFKIDGNKGDSEKKKKNCAC